MKDERWIEPTSFWHGHLFLFFSITDRWMGGVKWPAITYKYVFAAFSSLNHAVFVTLRMKRIEDLNVLILEDDRIFAEVLSRNLSRVGLDMSKISIFDSIETENKDFTESKPDVVFLDLNIIGSSGLETFYAAEPIFPNACFIILSGHNDEQLAMNCMEAGAQDYISKSDASAYALLKSIQYGLIRKEQLLKEQLYVKAFKYSPFASVIIQKKEGKILQVNEAYERRFGHPVNDNAEQIPFLKTKSGAGNSGEWFASVVKKSGEEQIVKIWGECIDKNEDLFIYKMIEKDPVSSWPSRQIQNPTNECS